MAIIRTEAVAETPAAPDPAPGAGAEGPEIGADAVDESPAPGRVAGDLEILAELEASGETAEGEEAESAETPAAPPVKEDDKPETPAAAPESAELRKARSILAVANRRLAKANGVRDQVRQELAAALKTKPHATLRELGISLGEVLDAGDQDAPAAGDKPQTVEERIAAVEKRAQDAELAKQVAEVNAEVERLKTGVHGQLRAAAKDFPRINAGGAHELVTDLMVEYHAAHGKPLPVAQAAKLVEDYLDQLAGGKASPAPKSEAPPSKGQPTPKRQGSQTLANNETRNVGPGPDDLPDDPDARVAAVMREMGLGLSN